MPDETRRSLTLLVILALATPRIASADVFWPPLLYVSSYAVWWVVVGGLVVELLVYKWGFGRGWYRSALLTVGVNLASAAACVTFAWGSRALLIGPGGLGDSSTWHFALASPLILYAITTLTEYVVAVTLFRVAKGLRSLAIVAAAHAPSVALASWGALRLAGRALGGGS